MPATIVGAIGAAAGWGAATIATVTTVVNVAMFVGSIALSNFQRKNAQKQARDQFNASQVDRFANVVTTSTPHELVLGRVRKGGAVAFRGSAGWQRQELIAHIALADHEIDAVEAVYLNDVQVTLDSNGWVQDAPYNLGRRESVREQYVGVTAGVPLDLSFVPDPYSGSAIYYDDADVPHAIGFTVVGQTVTFTETHFVVWFSYQYTIGRSYARLRWDLGAGTAVADSRTRELFPDQFTSAHRGQGVAKLIAEFLYNETAFPSGLPVVSALVRGAKVYDPRTGLTAWSENPAILLRHVYQHDYFGKATVSADEDARIIVAANACDTSHDWVVDGVTETAPLYRAGLVAQYGTPAGSLLDDLSQAMAGMWCFAGGELFVRAGVYTAKVQTFGDADLAIVQRSEGNDQQDQLSISVHRERAEKFNVVNLSIWDGGQDYRQTTLAPVKADALITRDGAELAQPMALAAVSYAPQAQHIAGVMIRDARDPLTIEAPFKMCAYPIEPLDTIELALTRYGWASVPKTFLVLGRVWDHERSVIRLTCKETSAAIYTPDAEFLPQGSASNTALPTPWDIEPPGTLTLASGTDELLIAGDGTVITRVRVAWPTMTDERVLMGGQIEVQWCDTTVGVWKPVVVDGAVTSMYLMDVADGTAILVRARTRTAVASSDWGVQQQHLVLGKTVPPGVPTGVSVTQELVFFRAPTDLDLAGVRIRSIPGVVASPVFSRGTDVIEGLVTTSPARIERKLYGVQTIVVVAEDTSGNQSAPSFATLDFGLPDVSSAIWAFEYAALSFPGAYTDCTLSGGEVVADASASADVYVLDNLYGEPDVYATLYDAMTWQSDALITPFSGVLALSDAVAGNSPLVEYRIAADALADLYLLADLYASADLYGAPSEWSLWPGSLAVQRMLPIEFRVSISASSEQGAISEFTLSLVMDEVSQTFANVTVSASGTRMDPAAGSPPRNWVGALRAVYGWPAVDGSGAIAGRVLDFSTELGPLVQFVDNAGTPVTALGTVKVEGYSDE